jgi:hypothetical protein
LARVGRGGRRTIANSEVESSRRGRLRSHAVDTGILFALVIIEATWVGVLILALVHLLR